MALVRAPRVIDGVDVGVFGMSKILKSKSDVIEWYWPDFLNYCMKDRKHQREVNGWQCNVQPTEDNFWQWYITTGPLGVKEAGRYYSKEEIEYV